jgi:fatty acid desaturase
MRVSTSGRVSNLIGAAFSWLDLPGSGFGRGGAFAAAGFTATGFATAGFATAGFAITGFAITGLGAGLLGFTVTFDVAGDGFVFAGGRTTFFGAAAL